MWHTRLTSWLSNYVSSTNLFREMSQQTASWLPNKPRCQINCYFDGVFQSIGGESIRPRFHSLSADDTPSLQQQQQPRQQSTSANNRRHSILFTERIRFIYIIEKEWITYIRGQFWCLIDHFETLILWFWSSAASSWMSAAANADVMFDFSKSWPLERQKFLGKTSLVKKRLWGSRVEKLWLCCKKQSNGGSKSGNIVNC